MKLLARLAVGALLVTACGSDRSSGPGVPPSATLGSSPTPVKQTASPAAGTADATRASQIFGQFELGDGRRMHIACMGDGSPTILLEAGGNDNSKTWPASLFKTLSARTRTCAYDRAGTGNSDRAPGPRLAKDVLADLDALLLAAHVDGPYLLVGTSFGGQVSLYHALQHPERVAGMVILDSDWPSLDPTRDATRSVLTKAQWADLVANDRWDGPGNLEQVDFQGTLPEIAKVEHPLPGIPIRILTATRTDVGDCPPGWDCVEIARRGIEFQKDWLALSPTVTQILVDAGHVMHHEVPDLVGTEILKALDEVAP